MSNRRWWVIRNSVLKNSTQSPLQYWNLFIMKSNNFLTSISWVQLNNETTLGKWQGLSPKLVQKSRFYCSNCIHRLYEDWLGIGIEKNDNMIMDKKNDIKYLVFLVSRSDVWKKYDRNEKKWVLILDTSERLSSKAMISFQGPQNTGWSYIRYRSDEYNVRFTKGTRLNRHICVYNISFYFLSSAKLWLITSHPLDRF